MAALKRNSLAIFVVVSGLAFAAAALADTPFAQGTVDGRWIGAVLQAGGASGNIFVVPVYAKNVGQVSKIGELSPADVGGATISALFFSRGKMYVTNDLSLPGECQACFDYAVVRRFGIVRGVLTQEAVGVVPYPNGGPNTARFRAKVLAARLRSTPSGPQIGALPLP